MNHWIEQKTEELRPLLSLIVDKINLHGYMMGAHKNRNWHTNSCYEFPPEMNYKSTTLKMQGTLDRIGKIEYHICHHTDGKKGDWNPPILGEDIFDHLIRCEWKELFGMGQTEEEVSDILKSTMLKDTVGNYHFPCDQSMTVMLYHPSSQAFQEKVAGYWDNLSDCPWWRPEYHYTEDEVDAALQIMCKTFNWEYEKKPSSRWMKM